MDLNLPEKKLVIAPASFWKRMLAFGIDLLVIDFFILSLFSPVAEALVDTADFASVYNFIQSGAAQSEALAFAFLLVALMAWAYFALMNYASGQTMGCLIMNLYVVEHKGQDFMRPKLWQCFLRNMFTIPVFPFVFFLVIDPIYLIFARKGKRITEWVSSTRVVEMFEL